MKTGTVVGRLWSSKRLPELPAGALIEVQLDCPKDVVVCFDPLGCGEGERVLITIGAPAAWWFAPAQQRVVVDALIIGVLDESSKPTLPK
jgi:ethanolamine utilization protein EutN